MNMRRKARNQAMDKARMGQRFMTAVVGAGAAYGMGFMMGSRTAKGETTQISGVDMEIVFGGGSAVLGIFLQGKAKLRKIGEFLESGGMGVIAYYAGSKGEDHGGTAAAA